MSEKDDFPPEDTAIFFVSDDAIELILEMHGAVEQELGPDAVDAAYSDLSFDISTHGTVERIPGSMITRLESHHDPRALLAIIEREGKETVRVAFGEQKGESVERKLVEMLANEYQKDPRKEHLKIYFKLKLMQDMDI